MAYRMPLPSENGALKRTYENLSGADFANYGTFIARNRSGEAVNVYKNYRNSAGKAVQSRPGFERRAEVSGKINGVHIFGASALIHHGSSLSVWTTFPETAASGDITLLYSQMNDSPSSSFVFDEKLYILDGQSYLVYDGAAVSEVKNSASIPVTRINADPDGSGGAMYQSVNMLTPKRRNTFVSDGASLTYKLDAESFDTDGGIRVWINEEELTSGFTAVPSSGSVAFESAPMPPLTSGTANVTIEYSRTVAAHLDRVQKCTVAQVFDSRVFLSNNDALKGVVLHSALSDAAYFPDDAYYNDGSDMSEVKALTVSSGRLIAIKSDKGNENKIYAHTPSLDYADGKVYPVESISVTLGCVSAALNFFDAIVYLSPLGLERLRLTAGGFSLSHASSFVDKKLTALSDYTSSRACIWDGYLAIVCCGNIFLADGMNSFGENGYEWFWWNGIGISEGETFYPAVNVFSYGTELFFTTNAGVICAMCGTNDDGKAFESAWVTPEDDFASEGSYKKLLKIGGTAKIKRIPNSVIKVAAKTDASSFTDILNAVTSGFCFSRVNFGGFTFGTGLSGLIVYRLGRQKVKNVMLKFYSDELDKPFGLYSATLTAEKKGYIK